MAFTNLPPDLVLPAGGSLTPGSGTVYIGGPQLPSSMSQFESAIIFYSDAVGLSHGIDYWYLAHFGQSHFPFTADGIQIGYYPTGGPNTLSMFGTFVDSNGRDDVTIETNTGNIIMNSRRQLTLQSLATFAMFIFSGSDLELTSSNNGLVYLASDFGNVSIRKTLASNTEIAEFRNLGTKPNVKALNSSTIDVWQTSTTTVTVTDSSSTSYPGCTLTVEWRLTIDWVLEIRFVLVLPGAGLNNCVFAQWAMPAGMPTLDSGPLAMNPFGSGFTSPAGKPIILRWDGTAMTVFPILSGAGQTDIEGTIITTIPKP